MSKIRVNNKNMDPLRCPKVQGQIEKTAKSAFSGVKLFGDLVETMVKIQKMK